MEEEYMIPEIYFSKLTAEQYEKSPRMRKIQKEMTERALELLGLKNGKILDVGCGTGFSTKTIQEAGFDVIGVDISEPMVRIAKEKGLKVIKADFRKLLFKENEFNGIISISALQWIHGKSYDEIMENYEKVAKEFYRVLKKNGKAVVQFYPKTEAEFNLAVNSFKKAKFSKIDIAVDYPEIPKKRKRYIILKK